MRAVLATGYGSPDVLRIGEVDEPTPKRDQLRVRVHACTVTAGDVTMRGVRFPDLYWFPVRLMYGFGKPRHPITGYELAGDVESVGADVTDFVVGDRVYGITGIRPGANAEYVCLPQSGGLARIPEGLDYASAAALTVGGTTALHFLRKAGLQAGQKVLVIGASGSVGTFAVQLACHLGAEVAGVCSTDNAGLVASLGASRVIDYTREDYGEDAGAYDVVFDTVGKGVYESSVRVLRPRGTLILGAVHHMSWYLRNIVTSLIGRKKVIAGIARIRVEDLEYLADLAASGDLRVVIDRRYPLEAVPEAHRYVDAGHKRGNVVVDVIPPGVDTVGSA